MQMMRKMCQLTTPIINPMVGEGVSPNDTVLAFIHKVIAVTDYKFVVSEIVFLVDM